MSNLKRPFTYTTDDGQLLTTGRPAPDLDAALYFGLPKEDFNMSDQSLLLSPGSNISSARWFNESCHLYKMPTDIIKNIIEPTIVTVGICGILLTLVVLTRKCMINSCNCYLTALAIGDLMTLVIITIRFLVEKFVDCEMKRGAEGAMMDLYSMIIMDIFHNLAVGVTVMLAVERYIAICHPMRAMGMCTVRRARIIIVLLAIVSTILMCPRFMDIEVSFARKTSGEVILTATHAYKYDNQLYNYIVTVSLLTFLPLVTLLILNGRIIYEVHRSSRYLQNYLGVDWRVRSVVSSEELKITMMLVSVVLAFFVCHAPYMVYMSVIAVVNYDTTEHSVLTSSDSLTYLRHVCHSLLALKSCCNFVLYCWFSDKFWATFKRTFCKHRCLGKQAHFGHGSCNNGHHCRFNSRTHPLRSSDYVSKETTC